MIALALWPDAVVFGAVGGLVAGLVWAGIETLKGRKQ